MFQESLIASNPSTQPRSRVPALVSIGVQAALVALLLTVPLLRPDVLPIIPDKPTALTPPTVHFTPPPPPPTLVHVETASTPTEQPPSPQPTAARQLPSLTTDAPTVDQPTLPVGITGPPVANPIAALNTGVPATPHIVVGPPAGTASAGHSPLSISQGVIAGLLISPIQPAYPQIARITRTEGSVVIRAIISKSGHIESAHVVSGPTMLQAAALAAVREARYRPFLLNNEPTEVETTITINFRLGS
jgi:protein TonB